MLSALAPSDASRGIVFLLDVDNTLYDNDGFSAELDARLVDALGEPGRVAYRALYASLRDQNGYADYLQPLQQLRRDFQTDPDLLQLSGFILDYPFHAHVYPGAMAAIAHLRTLGTTVILSDGDIVFQPRKIRCSGLWDAVQGNVLVYVHKEHMLEAVQEAFPASHYVMIDDKPKLLDAIKAVLGMDVTTVFVRQGHYAAEADPGFSADVTIERIDALIGMSADQLAPRAPTFQEQQ